MQVRLREHLIDFSLGFKKARAVDYGGTPRGPVFARLHVLRRAIRI